MGMLGQPAKGGLGLWARLFHAKGAIAPEHVAANFGQGGNFSFEQRNSGIEAGIDFAVSEELSVGLLLAKAEATQRLESPGAGNSQIEGDTSAPTAPGSRRRLLPRWVLAAHGLRRGHRRAARARAAPTASTWKRLRLDAVGRRALEPQCSTPARASTA
jgi:hypothetical protein